MIKKLHEVAEVETARRVKIAQDAFRDAVCSIYAVSGVKDVPHLGSGTLFTWEHQAFLITARHLLESGRQGLDFMAQSNRSLAPVSLSRRFIKSDEEQDLALCAINSREVESLGAKPIDGLSFFKFPISVDGRSLATIGWPNTKNEISMYTSKAGQQMMVSGPQKTAQSMGLNEALDKSFVYQKFVPHDAIDLNNRKTNPPKLKGLSGGLTFDLGNPIDPEILNGEKEFVPYPVGICTKYDTDRKVIRSTRPGDFIREFLDSGIILEC